MAKKINIDELNSYYNCPCCGSEETDWICGEMNDGIYYDNYVCSDCGKEYTFVYELKAAYIKEE